MQRKILYTAIVLFNKSSLKKAGALSIYNIFNNTY